MTSCCFSNEMYLCVIYTSGQLFTSFFIFMYMQQISAIWSKDHGRYENQEEVSRRFLSIPKGTAQQKVLLTERRGHILPASSSFLLQMVSPCSTRSASDPEQIFRKGLKRKRPSFPIISFPSVHGNCFHHSPYRLDKNC